MCAQPRNAPRYSFVATAQAEDGSDVRPARVRDLSILGAYLVLPNPFSKSVSILVKIRTGTEFFQCLPTVEVNGETGTRFGEDALGAPALGNRKAGHRSPLFRRSVGAFRIVSFWERRAQPQHRIFERAGWELRAARR